MTKNAWVLGILALVMLAGCTAGPSYLSRTVDDWQNCNYEEEPLITGILSDVIPLYPLGKFVGMLGDYLILNPIQFWGFDVWRGEGASFMHANPAGAQETWFPSFFDQGE